MATIGFITTKSEALKRYFPTLAEPDLVPQELPFTPDDWLLVNALRQQGHTVKAVVWGTDVSEITGYDLLIVRSPWDYMNSDENYRAFLHWLERLELRGHHVENPVPVVRWLLDKHYLRHFEQAGVSIVPSRFIEAGSSFDLQACFSQEGPLVVKPCVSAAGQDLFWVDNASGLDVGQSRFDDLIRQKSLIVQPLLPEIQTRGEWSLVFLDGCYSHAVHKLPKADSILVHAEKGGQLRFADAPVPLQAFGQHVIDAFAEACRFGQVQVERMPLYMRVDLIETANGIFLSECEGVEPELFVRSRPSSVELFCQAVERRLREPAGAAIP